MRIEPYNGLTLSENQLRVLEYLYESSGGISGENAWYFRTIEKGAGLERRLVRLACRALARKGLTEYVRGLVNEADGMMAGSGYGITALGVQVMERKEELARVREEAKAFKSPPAPAAP